jgi:hypothetical protein
MDGVFIGFRWHNDPPLISAGGVILAGRHFLRNIYRLSPFLEDNS